MTTRRITRATRIHLQEFDFHSILGKGAFGKVLLATHRDSLSRVAVKMVKKKPMVEDPTSTLNEREVLEMVTNNPFCVQAYATFQTENHLFFVMEYMGGGDLESKIKKKTPLTLLTIRRVSAELLCGVKFLHSRGIFHRDLKPANILVHLNGHVKIADFGLSVMGMHGRTVEGLIGTFSYFAPEVIFEEPHDQRADYFSLGVLLYEAAFCELPFPDRSNLGAMKFDVCYCTPSYADDADPNLVNFLQKLLEKKADERERAIADIEHHPFFQEINWVELAVGEADPPFPARWKSHINQRKKIINLEAIMNQKEAIADEEEAIADEEEEEEAIADEEEAIADEEEAIADEEEAIADEEEAISAREQALFIGFSFISDEWIAMQNGYAL